LQFLLHFYYDSDRNEVTGREGADFCEPWMGALTQMFALASLLFYFGIPVDLMYGLNTPFSAPQLFTGYYQVCVTVYGVTRCRTASYYCCAVTAPLLLQNKSKGTTRRSKHGC
jgi:hypothetical protein